MHHALTNQLTACTLLSYARSRSPTPPEVREARERERELAELERATRTVFAYNINLKADERDIYEFFSKGGEVTDIRLITDRHTKRSKGLAYVEFAKQDEVFVALALTGAPAVQHVMITLYTSATCSSQFSACLQLIKPDPMYVTQHRQCHYLFRCIFVCVCCCPKGALGDTSPSSSMLLHAPPCSSTALLLPPLHKTARLTGQPLLGQAVMVKPAEAEKNVAWEAAQAAKAAGGAAAPDALTDPLAAAAGPLRLRVSGLKPGLGDAEVRQIFEPFGKLDAVELDLAAGSALVVFSSAQAGSNAQAHWHGRSLLDSELRVVTEGSGTGSTTAAAAAVAAAAAAGAGALGPASGGAAADPMAMLAAANAAAAANSLLAPGLPAAPPGLLPGTLPGTLLPGGAILPGGLIAPPAAAPGIATASQGRCGVASPSPTPCLLLQGMFDATTQAEPNWEAELLEDVQEEAGRFGQVLHLFVDATSAVRVLSRACDVWWGGWVSAWGRMEGRRRGGGEGGTDRTKTTPTACCCLIFLRVSTTPSSPLPTGLRVCQIWQCRSGGCSSPGAAWPLLQRPHDPGILPVRSRLQRCLWAVSGFHQRESVHLISLMHDVREGRRRLLPMLRHHTAQQVWLAGGTTSGARCCSCLWLWVARCVVWQCGPRPSAHLCVGAQQPLRPLLCGTACPLQARLHHKTQERRGDSAVVERVCPLPAQRWCPDPRRIITSRQARWLIGQGSFDQVHHHQHQQQHCAVCGLHGSSSAVWGQLPCCCGLRAH